jgi:hypothetical protein
MAWLARSSWLAEQVGVSPLTKVPERRDPARPSDPREIAYERGW